jgi:hypothetical protein
MSLDTKNIKNSNQVSIIKENDAVKDLASIKVYHAKSPWEGPTYFKITHMSASLVSP